MKQPVQQDMALCQGLLSQGYTLWEGLGLPPLSQEEKAYIPSLIMAGDLYPHPGYLAAACQSFALFRTLHSQSQRGDPKVILLGDYFFGIFSQCLIPLDSTWLTLEFSKFLCEDTEEGVGGQMPFDKEKYHSFVSGLTHRWMP